MACLGSWHAVVASWGRERLLERGELLVHLIDLVFAQLYLLLVLLQLVLHLALIGVVMVRHHDALLVLGVQLDVLASDVVKVLKFTVVDHLVHVVGAQQ